MADNGTPPYPISPANEVLGRMKTWAVLAGRVGKKEWYLTTLKAIDSNLSKSPETWGDPLFSYHHLNMRMFHRVFEGFYLYYGIHDSTRTVYLRQMFRMPGVSI
jgi:hypothetical protein